MCVVVRWLRWPPTFYFHSICRVVFAALTLFGDGVDEEVGSHVVHVGHEDGAVVGSDLLRVVVVLHSRVPVLPLTCQTVTHGTRKGQFSSALVMQRNEGRETPPICLVYSGSHSHRIPKHKDSRQSQQNYSLTVAVNGEVEDG